MKIYAARRSEKSQYSLQSFIGKDLWVKVDIRYSPCNWGFVKVLSHDANPAGYRVKFVSDGLINMCLDGNCGRINEDKLRDNDAGWYNFTENQLSISYPIDVYTTDELIEYLSPNSQY